MEKDLFQSACLPDSLDASTQHLSEIQEEVLQHGGDEHEHRILVHEGERKEQRAQCEACFDIAES